YYESASLSHMLYYSSTSPPPLMIYPLTLHDALPILEAAHPGRPGALPAAPPPGPSAVPARPVPVLRRGACARRGASDGQADDDRSEEHTSELQSRFDLVCRLLLEKKNY